ncbi:hypothetical protein [Azonexus sp.]|jgi:CBS-domain-containing membrane protein|uniref:hypothetical protein n=1 Tax=Azonexus sp. TaxID=1872668 RepID=UPI00281FA90B|nr:hypothetical protein [Azonexus sp.]MDR1994246.1 hypothetical protein [Azonexus sp.]
MKRSFLANQIERFKLWWREPPTWRDRITGALVGSIGGFWIGILGRIILGPLPAPFSVVLLWGIGAIILFAVIGTIFPKPVSIILFPFSIWG